MGKPIDQGRWMAEMDEEEIIVFVIGMRINQIWRVDQWFWMIGSMGGMLRYLNTHKEETGFIKAHNWFGRTTMQLGYWRSIDDLVAFAEDKDLSHMPAWKKYYLKVAKSQSAGVFHETYTVKPGQYETIYVNMPLFGLGAATNKRKVHSDSSSLRQRVRDNQRVADAAGPGEPVATGGASTGCPFHSEGSENGATAVAGTATPS